MPTDAGVVSGDTVERTRELLRSQVEGRRFVVANDVVVPAALVAAHLHRLGADDVLIVGGSRGTGDVEPQLEASVVDLGLRSPPGVLAGIRAFETVLRDPPSSLVGALEAFDPDATAWVVGPPTCPVTDLLGRRVFGARPAAWRALEDKTTVDVLWDEVGVTRAPSQVVPAAADALAAASRALDRGRGVVWVADNRDGWHGGAEHLRWVRDGADDAAVDAMRDVADRVRVMPFLDGIPCSIHGWVIGDEVAVFAPVEMIVLRTRRGDRLRYAGAATTWRAPADDRDQMRDTAYRVGGHLRDTYGYRGVFTIDGVLTVDGFRPTELNPRYGFGLGLQGRSTGLPLYLVHGATVEHPDLDWRPAELEATILAATAARPEAAAHTIVDERVTGTLERHVMVTDGTLRATDVASATGRLVLGPATAGGLLRVELDDLAVGRPFAPTAALAFGLAAEEFGLDLPDLEAAPEVRSGPPLGS